ncbi:hypothetical protein L1889_18240 [Paenalcaligenes niemegkensis]|uniref:hypothetical protein n=1 Tax=Paenalcaligenes niemegkensis TaxID=2895469 RepID=UPI001EE8059D|nr:hypothetical protein [Paenalcaligenes niemegkensis]MCQ9618380.1 hypothetical protein [Paenalcaligenes niemegkensis]
MIASTAVGVIAIVILSIAWSALWFGLALSVLWGWFIVPLFGVAQIGAAQAYGLILVLRVLQAKAPSKDEQKASFGERIVRIVWVPPLAAGVLILTGWAVSAWV